MTAVCPECGHEFRNVESSGNVKAFFDKLEKADSRIAGSKRGSVGRVILIVWIVLVLIYVPIFNEGNDIVHTIAVIIALIGIVAALVFVRKFSFSEDEKKKKSIIENFLVPNTKEDLLEFLVLASSQIVPAYGFSYAARQKQAWNQVWTIKCNQLYTKAEIALAGSAESLATIKGIREKFENSVQAAKKRIFVTVCSVTAVLIAGIAVFSFMALWSDVSVPESVSIAPENVRLSGAFADNLKVTGSGVTITTDKKVSFIKITVEVEALKAFGGDLDDLVEQKIQKIAASKKWGREYISFNRSTPQGSFKVIVSSTPEKSYSFQNGSYGKDIFKIKPGVSQVLTVIQSEKAKGTPADRRKAVAEFMALGEIEIELQYKYMITYRKGSFTMEERVDIEL